MKELLDIIQIALMLTVLYVLAKGTFNKPSLRNGNRKKLLLDSCVLIDGRILEIANAGFTPSELIIPRFVINELQMLADGNDSHKRERARFGLDVVQSLQKEADTLVTVYPDDTESRMPTDDKLVKTAKKLGADLCTIDYNLNKVAKIEGVTVLNINELANAIRPVALPGEKRNVKIVQKGSNKEQGVGYADDGSMIVVEGALKLIGKTVEVEISRFIQTDAGKMLFAQLLKSPRPEQRQKRS